MTIKQDLDLIEKHAGFSNYGAVSEAISRVRAFVDSSIVDRLERVEEDLMAFRASHATAPIGPQGVSRTGRVVIARVVFQTRNVSRDTLYDFVRTASNFVPQDGVLYLTAERDVRLVDPPIVTDGPEVLTPAEQEAQCWRKIERWNEPRGLGALTVEFSGPYGYGSRLIYYCRLANGQSAKGASRLDALAQVAQWCELHTGDATLR